MHADIAPILRASLAREAQLMTDKRLVRKSSKEFASYDTVDHSKDKYARYEGDRVISTNPVEGYYSVFIRGMKGVYEHCKEKHLHRRFKEGAGECGADEASDALDSIVKHLAKKPEKDRP
ncbi:MAG TPA: transposase [Lacipirellulaceae bacterium]|jgi:hypothetical protein|nr:transposase [Lacipirellulaceae bacterium]